MAGDQRRTFLSLSSCNAITPAGLRVQIPWGDGDGRVLQNDSAELIAGKDNYVVVMAHDDRIPVGDVADEIPRRQKDSLPRYTVDLFTSEMVLSDDRCVAVAKIPKSDRVSDATYVPPCAVMGAHRLLRDYACDIITLCREMMENAAAVAHREGETSSRNEQMIEFAKAVAFCVGGSIDSLDMTYAELPPYKLYEFVLRLARSARLMFTLLPEKRATREFYDTLKKRGFRREQYDPLEKRVLDSIHEYVQHDVMLHFDPMRRYVTELAHVFKGGRDRTTIIE